MLAIVEHDEEPALGDELQQRLAGRALRIQDPESRSDRFIDPRGIADGREVHPADTIAIAVRRLLRHSQRQPRLSASAYPGQRDEPARLDLAGKASQLLSPADKTRATDGRRFEPAVRAAGRRDVPCCGVPAVLGADGLDGRGDFAGVRYRSWRSLASARLMIDWTDAGR